MQYNERQLEAIEHFNNPLEVIASAGSGKTSLLLERTRVLVEEKGVPQNEILVISFTNNTASELMEKLKKRGLPSVKVGTFHAIAREILVKDGNERVNNSVPEWEIKKNFEKYLEEPLNDIVDILSFISLQKTSFKKPTDKDLLYLENHRAYDNFTHEQLVGMYGVYENLLKEKNAYDFDDWLIECCKVCESNVGRYCWSFLEIDEAQDSNPIQHKLRRLWCNTGNIMIVGDYRQSLYGFNNARPEDFMNFYKEYDNSKVINMNINYRSCDNIVKCADKFINPYYSSFKYNEDTIANNKNNGYISYRKYAEKTQEAVDVVDEIEMLIKNEVPLNQIAVLYRNNAHADFVECELRSRKIPYAVSGNGSFFKRKFISGIIAIMRLLENEDNDQAFEDLFRFKPDPLTYFSKKDLMDIKKLASKDGISYLEGFNKIKFAEAWKNTNKRKFFMKFRGLDDHYVSLESMINTIVSVFNIENQIRNDYENKEDVQEHLDSIDTLKKFAKGTSLEGFLKFVDGANNTKQKQTKDGVRLMTVHASKGLEFQCCFLISVEEGKFPNPRADITEEANIFYVGVTRAKQYLQISSIGDSDFIEPYTRNISSKDFLGTRKREVISRIVEEEGKKEVKTAKKQGDLFDF